MLVTYLKKGGYSFVAFDKIVVGYNMTSKLSLPFFLKFLIILILLFQLKLCHAQNGISRNHYSISGTAENIKDGSILVLEYSNISDSTKVFNEHFKFVGHLKHKVEHALIKTTDLSDYKYFWLEPKKISFKAKRGNFYYAKISGSETQNEQNILLKETEPIELLIDDLSKQKDATVQNKMVIDSFNILECHLKEINIQFIIAHPKSIVSLNTLFTYYSSWGKEKSKSLYEILEPGLKNTNEGKQISHYIQFNRDIIIGKHFVDFTQYNMESKPVRLSDVKGKNILLEFWASWCTPCRAANKMLLPVYERFKKDQFEIVNISIDTDKNEWQTASESDSIQWLNLSELDMKANRAAMIYGVSTIPVSYLIDSNANIIAKNIGIDSLISYLSHFEKNK